ncbi:hypothetical protein ZIOFF_029386 [Zingiber officinale]|uniref:C2H2-type domain-containing protein n=2 Tax=Zingiber officinale TaxID=94328 RepID=A0A8J5GWK9_ZINOF|nr:hypothetical protein ZIOFF_029386 [Zingiber officinale]
MRATQENNDGNQSTDPSPKLKMDGFYACPVCPRNFRNGLALGGHLASHRRAKKNADQGASNQAQVNHLPANPSSQPQAPTPIGSDSYSKRSLKFNFAQSQQFMSSANRAGESSTQPSNFRFHRVIQRFDGWATAERLQTRDFLVLMGRGRGKGKKLTASTSHEDSGKSGEEVLPYRRGRPQKPLKGDVDEDGAEEIEGEDDLKLSAPNQEAKGATTVNVKKRKRDSKSTENGVAGSESMEQPTSSNDLRHSRRRRKNKPRRAAEAGVECK